MAVEVKALRDYIHTKYGSPRTVYLDLYIKRVRLLVYSDEFEQHIHSQIPYIVSKDNTDEFDATVELWKETDPAAPDIISEYDEETDTYYYGVKNLEYEEFIKQGHFLVQIFYRILKTERSSLVHGAVVGMDGEGVLLCARGQRGKSTLTVLSMLNGMEYVSDDYLLLEQDEDGGLYASPIYSIITLSPFMTEQLGAKLDGCVKLGGNARKDKYVFNIANMHGSFRERYPIKLLMFPEIVESEDALIRKASPQEKGRAITQLLHSTTSQMNDAKDARHTKNLIGMVSNFDCFYFGLSTDIERNSAMLKQFMKEREYKK